MSSLVRRALGRAARAVLGHRYDDLDRALAHRSSPEAQVLLSLAYRDLASRGVVPRFDEVGFRCHSQFEEDGILLFLFALLGTTNRTAVELCAGDGIESMSANLLLNHGWWGHLFDGDARKVARGRAYFRAARETALHPPRFTHAWVTAENVNDVLRDAGVPGEVDLLALDLDGVDYWVWKALAAVRPRVVVCETQNVIGPEDALTVPYDPRFAAATPDHLGASLAAMTKLAEAKGYRLVGTNRYGFNAFFVLADLGAGLLPAVTPERCLRDPYSREARAVRWPKVRDLPWVRV